jgi:hypothetical protein
MFKAPIKMLDDPLFCRVEVGDDSTPAVAVAASAKPAGPAVANSFGYFVFRRFEMMRNRCSP